MALAFNKVRSTVLDLTDTIKVGKLQGCRVCDVIPDYYEYLIWADREGVLKFTKRTIESIQEHALYKQQQQHYLEEVAPWQESDSPELEDIIHIDDVPF